MCLNAAKLTLLCCEQWLDTHCICVLKDRVGLYSLMERVGQLNKVLKERQSFAFFFFFFWSLLDLVSWCNAKSDDKQWETSSQSVKHNDLLQFHQEIIKITLDFPHIHLSYSTFPVCAVSTRDTGLLFTGCNYVWG